MTDSFAKEPYYEEGWNRKQCENCSQSTLKKSPAIDGIPIELFQVTDIESAKILTKIYQKNMKSKAVDLRLEMFNVHFNP